MTITLEGEFLHVPDRCTIANLLARLEIDGRTVAVERNCVVVKRDQYGATPISDGDQIEIVNFVGGGSGDLVIW